MFTNHAEGECKPFIVLSRAFMECPRPLAIDEVFWGIMKNYRHPSDSIHSALEAGKAMSNIVPPVTPLRRLKHMLQLMRSIDAVESYRSSGTAKWAARDKNCLCTIAYYEGGGIK